MRKHRSTMKEAGGIESSPYFILLLLFLLALVILNILVVVYPLVIEGVMIGDIPPVSTSLDRWSMKVFFGDFPQEQFESILIGKFIPVLLEVYLLSLLAGLLVSMALLRKTNGELLRDRETTFSDKRLLKLFLDIIILGPFALLASDRILAFLIQYPLQLSGMSYLSLYFLTGFITGSTIGKFTLPLRIHLECRRHNLQLRVIYLTKTDSSGRPTRWMLDKWVLTPTHSEKTGWAMSERKGNRNDATLIP